jgi:hypothetical protein
MSQLFSLSSTSNLTPVETYQQKISHLKALYHLACADNIYTRSEAVYIRSVAQRFGIDEAELQNFDGSEPDLELPGHEHKLYSLFHRLAVVIMVDNEITTQEKEYCFNLGVKMGLHPSAINEIIASVEDGDFGAAPNDVTDIFRKYLN